MRRQIPVGSVAHAIAKDRIDSAPPQQDLDRQSLLEAPRTPWHHMRRARHAPCDPADRCCIGRASRDLHPGSKPDRKSKGQDRRGG